MSTLPRPLRETIIYDEAKQLHQAFNLMALSASGHRALIDHASEKRTVTFFVHDDKECGKTFTLNTLLKAICWRSHVALVVDTLGVAATLI